MSPKSFDSEYQEEQARLAHDEEMREEGRREILRQIADCDPFGAVGDYTDPQCIFCHQEGLLGKDSVKHYDDCLWVIATKIKGRSE